MAADPARGRRRGDLGHRVDHAVRVRRRAGDDQHGGRRRSRRPSPPASARKSGPTGTSTRLDAEVVRGLVERRVRGGGQHHARARRRRGGASRARLHGQQARLGAARGHRADRRVRGVEQAAGEADQLVLHLQQAGERGRVERRWSRRTPRPPRGRSGRPRVARSRRRRPACGRRARAGRRPAAPRSRASGRHGHWSAGLRRVCAAVDLGGVEGVAAQPPQADQGQGGRQQREAQRDRGAARSRAG